MERSILGFIFIDKPALEKFANHSKLGGQSLDAPAQKC